MSRATKWRPWQFSLRSLLLLTAVIAVGAAFVAWRARQLGPQRRAVARIVELGGSVEMERRGWFEAITRGCDTDEVVSVTLPGHLTDEALPELKALSALRHVTMGYSRFYAGNMGSAGNQAYYFFEIDQDLLVPTDEQPRFDLIRARLSLAQIDVSHDGVVVPTDIAFRGY